MEFGELVYIKFYFPYFSEMSEMSLIQNQKNFYI